MNSVSWLCADFCFLINCDYLPKVGEGMAKIFFFISKLWQYLVCVGAVQVQGNVVIVWHLEGLGGVKGDVCGMVY